MTPHELRSIRESLGLTSTEAAASLGVSARTYERWEQGVHPVSKARAIAIRQVLKAKDRRAVAK